MSELATLVRAMTNGVQSPIIREQPKPKKSKAPYAWDLVFADMKTRDKMGMKKYSQRLQPENGRDMLQDAYEEALDMCVYLRAAIYERDGK